MSITEPILLLSATLATRLSTELSIAIGSPVTVERRYAPYWKAADLIAPKWVTLLREDSIERQLRNLAPGELSIDVALQAALPEIAGRDDEFIDVDACDAFVEMVGKLKSLYRPGGVMRDETVAGAEFRSYKNAPIYRPDLLVANGIFTSVVSLVYYFEHNDE